MIPEEREALKGCHNVGITPHETRARGPSSAGLLYLGRASYQNRREEAGRDAAAAEATSGIHRLRNKERPLDKNVPGKSFKDVDLPTRRPVVF